MEGDAFMIIKDIFEIKTRRSLDDYFAFSKFVLFGAGGASHLTIDYLRKRNIKILCIADNDSSKWGKKHCDIDICSPEVASSQIDHNTAVIISSASSI